jgi:hypothetical protein
MDPELDNNGAVNGAQQSADHHGRRSGGDRRPSVVAHQQDRDVRAQSEDGTDGQVEMAADHQQSDADNGRWRTSHHRCNVSRRQGPIHDCPRLAANVNTSRNSCRDRRP